MTAAPTRADLLPPQSLEAERGLIGSVLRDNHVFDDIAGIVAADSFYHDAHQKIFRAMLDLRNADRPVDTVILFETLRQRKQLEDVGGAEYLADLWDAAPTAANAVYYARLISEKKRTRDLIHTCTELLRDAYDGIVPADELLVQAERRLTELVCPDRASLRWLNGVLQETITAIDQRCRPGADTGLPTGIHGLDSMTGGLHAGELICLAGRPGDGKSALAAMIAESAAQHGGGRPVLLVSLEMMGTEIGERLLVRDSGVDGWRVKKGKLLAEDGHALNAAFGRLKQLPIILEDGSDITLSRVVSIARRVHRRHGLSLLIIDYLQLIESEGRHLHRHEQVGAISRGLKALAKELGVPVVAVAQLNRESEANNRPPRLSDIRESGAVEQDSDIVAALYRPTRPAGNEDPPPGESVPMELLILKHRGGPRGSLPLLFEGPRFRFVEDLPT